MGQQKDSVVVAERKTSGNNLTIRSTFEQYVIQIPFHIFFDV